MPSRLARVISQSLPQVREGAVGVAQAKKGVTEQKA
jgi:hypothetical protein